MTTGVHLPSVFWWIFTSCTFKNWEGINISSQCYGNIAVFPCKVSNYTAFSDTCLVWNSNFLKISAYYTSKLCNKKITAMRAVIKIFDNKKHQKKSISRQHSIDKNQWQQYKYFPYCQQKYQGWYLYFGKVPFQNTSQSARLSIPTNVLCTSIKLF